MVGDGDPVQWPVLFESLAVVGDDFPTGGNLEEVVRGQRHPKHSRVEGVAGVNVGHAPIDSVGEILVRVGRIIGRLLFSPLGRGFGILGAGEMSEAAGRQYEGDDQPRADCVIQWGVCSHGVRFLPVGCAGL
jgi:hypothetical protein